MLGVSRKWFGHSTDRPVSTIFKSGIEPACLGVIGSKSKRGALFRELKGGYESQANSGTKSNFSVNPEFCGLHWIRFKASRAKARTIRTTAQTCPPEKLYQILGGVS